MAGLSNEIYVVHTLSSGDIAVGISELIDYKDMIKLVGYNSYNYHEYISQSLVNLTDEIILLKGGVAAQATHELEQAVADAKKVIIDETAKINTAIVGIIEEQVNQTISETAEANVAIKETQDTHTQDITKSKADIVTLGTKIKTVEDVLNTPITGLIAKSANHSSSIDDIDFKLGYKSNVDGLGVTTPGSGILGNVETLQIQILDIPTVKTTMTEISKVVGTAYNSKNTTLSSDLAATIAIIFKGSIPITDTGRGIYNEIYNGNDGVLKRLDLLDALKQSIQTLTTNTTSSGAALVTLISDNDQTKTDVVELQTIVGESETTGLQGRIKNIENLDIANKLSTNASNITTMQGIVGNSSSGLVKDNNNNIARLTALTTNYTTLNDTVNTIQTDVSTIKSDITNLKTFDSNFAVTVGNLFTKNSINYNAAKLESMNNDITTLKSSDSSGQFKSYFYKSGNFIAEDQIGMPAINAWVADEVAGMKIKTNLFISDYLSSNVQFGKIATLESNLSSTNAKIDTINAGSSTTGSTSKKIVEALDSFKSQYIDGLTTTYTAQSNSINSLNVSLMTQITRINNLASFDTEASKKFDEIESESVKYSVLLPFLKKMILMSRNASTSDDAIIKTFDTIINNIGQISNDYSNNGNVTLTVSNKTLTYLATPIQMDPFWVPELGNEYYIRLRFITNRDTNDSNSHDIEYVDYLKSVDATPTLNIAPLSGSDILSGRTFYKMNRSISTTTPDVTVVSDTKTFDELLTSLQSNVKMEFFFDIGINPIAHTASNTDFVADLFATESFKVKLI